jgi:hypothetical protein
VVDHPLLGLTEFFHSFPLSMLEISSPTESARKPQRLPRIFRAARSARIASTPGLACRRTTKIDRSAREREASALSGA